MLASVFAVTGLVFLPVLVSESGIMFLTCSLFRSMPLIEILLPLPAPLPPLSSLLLMLETEAAAVEMKAEWQR